jgi:SAM-dependent methyltransferase
MIPQPILPILAPMLRYHVTSPHVLLWRTVELAVMSGLAARYDLPWRQRVDLDVGCGNGVLGHALIREVGVGFDLHRPSVRWTRSHKPAYRAVVEASATAMPFAAGSQRLVFSNSVIEHIPGRRALFDEIGRVLAPGGFLLLSTVSERFPQFALGQERPSEAERRALDASYDHFHYFSAASLGAELAARGVELLASASYIDARQARRCYELREWERRGPQGRLGQLVRLPVGLRALGEMRPLEVPEGQGAGLAIVARRLKDKG